jgi:2,2-dialkylglycine decarboxylase (pyruvate)
VPKPILTNEPADEYLIRYGVPFVPRLIERACGTLIWDEQGRELLDFTSGQMCATVGHNHPRIVQAIAEGLRGRFASFQWHAEPAGGRAVAAACFDAAAFALQGDVPVDRRRSK